MNTKIYVGNIPFQTTEPDLKTHFSQAGDVVSVKILKDHQTGQSAGVRLCGNVDPQGSSESHLHAE